MTSSGRGPGTPREEDGRKGDVWPKMGLECEWEIVGRAERVRLENRSSGCDGGKETFGALESFGIVVVA